jgi:hypothetical protein
MSLLPAIAVLAASPLALTLEIRSPQTAVLVGEPVKLIVTWRATGTLNERIFPENKQFTSQSLVFLVSDGRTQRAYRECVRSIEERIDPVVMLKKGEEIIQNLVLLRGDCVSDGGVQSALVFDAKGKYRLRAVYSKGQHRVESNELSFSVTDPNEEEQEVLEAVKHDRTMLDVGSDREAQAKAKALIAKHPKSRYLRWARLQQLQTKANAVHNQYDPDTRESMLALDKAAIRGFRTGKYADLAEGILADPDWGAFEEEALVLADTLAQASGDVALQQTVRKELFAKYPHSPAVKRIKAEEAEDAADNDEAEPNKPAPKPKQ